MDHGGRQQSQQQQQENLYRSDIVLRSPLDPSWSLLRDVDSAPSSSSGTSTSYSFRRLLRPRISALLVGAHVLRLQKLETIFTAGVLLHRYYCASILGGRENRDRDNDSRTDKQDTTTTTTPKQKKMDEEEEEKDDWKYIVAACLFLACKREEEPRRLRDVVNVAHAVSLVDEPQPQHQQNGVPKDNEYDPPDVLTWNLKPMALNQQYWTAKQRLVETELRVLRWLVLDIAVPHPHRAVVQLLQLYFMNAAATDDSDSDSEDDGPKHKDHTMGVAKQSLVRVAFRRLHDALYSSVALQQPVLALAVAAVELSLQEFKCTTPHHRNYTITKTSNEDNNDAASVSWWKLPRYGLDEMTIQAIPTALQCLEDASQSLCSGSNKYRTTTNECDRSIFKNGDPTDCL